MRAAGWYDSSVGLGRRGACLVELALGLGSAACRNERSAPLLRLADAPRNADVLLFTDDYESGRIDAQQYRLRLFVGSASVVGDRRRTRPPESRRRPVRAHLVAARGQGRALPADGGHGARRAGYVVTSALLSRG